jgi:N-acetylglutamate synthase-like GNAT family acetyltransferase
MASLSGKDVKCRMAYELVNVASESDWRAYHALRREVLWEARGRSNYNDRHADEHLPAHHPLLLKLDGRPIGTTRLDDLGNGRAAVRLVAIAIDAQGQGHGRALSVLVEDYARRLGINTLFVNAAPEAVGYYQKMSWEAYIWDETELTGIAASTTQMKKSLLDDS